MRANTSGAGTVGVGLRKAHFAASIAARDMPWVEVIPEAFVGVGGLARTALAAALERGPVFVHSVTLNLGGDTPMDTRLDGLARFIEHLEPPFVSDHLCSSAMGGVESFDLIPVPHSEAAADFIADRIKRAREVLGVPIAVENITEYATMPGGHWTPTRFVREVLDRSGASLLLDVANVVVNALNTATDPLACIDELPLDRVVQLHVAGHRFDATWGFVVDDHASRVSDATLAVLKHVLSKLDRPVPVLLEWDQHLPTLEVLLAHARELEGSTRAIVTRPT